MAEETTVEELVVTAPRKPKAETPARPRAELRQPRGVVTINGTRIDWESFEVETNAFSEADQFRVTLPTSSLPPEFDAAWWSTTPKAEVEIFAGFPVDAEAYAAADLTSLILGQVDDVDFEPSTGTLQISGRDLTALLVDAKTSAKYPNNSASSIVEKLAAAHGLTPVVTATSAKAGKYYSGDHVRLQSSRTEWELISYLAREEGFVAYVTGRELHFEPPAEDGEPVVLTYTPGEGGGPPTFDGCRVRFTRSLTIAKDITVRVRAWNAKQKKGFTKTARRAKSGAEAQEYSYSIPNLQPEEAQQRANKILVELTQQEMKVSIEGPADVVLKISDRIEIRGTGTGWDQAYHLDTITRRMSTDDGFEWSLTAKNHPTDSEAIP